MQRVTLGDSGDMGGQFAATGHPAEWPPASGRALAVTTGRVFSRRSHAHCGRSLSIASPLNAYKQVCCTAEQASSGTRARLTDDELRAASERQDGHCRSANVKANVQKKNRARMRTRFCGGPLR